MIKKFHPKIRQIIWYRKIYKIFSQIKFATKNILAGKFRNLEENNNEPKISAFPSLIFKNFLPKRFRPFEQKNSEIKIFCFLDS